MENTQCSFRAWKIHSAVLEPKTALPPGSEEGRKGEKYYTIWTGLRGVHVQGYAMLGVCAVCRKVWWQESKKMPLLGHTHSLISLYIDTTPCHLFRSSGLKMILCQ